MCVQYMIRADIKQLALHLGAKLAIEGQWRTHVFPRYSAPVVVADEGGEPVFRQMDFGLIPFFERSEKPKKVFHNARSETACEKPSFKDAFLRRRCSVPLDCFFEYVGEGRPKTLIRITPADEGVLMAAGIWTPWKAPDGSKRFTFAVLTGAPPEVISRAGHDRCPVFLSQPAWKEWIARGPREAGELRDLIGAQRPPELRVETAPPRAELEKLAEIRSLG